MRRRETGEKDPKLRNRASGPNRKYYLAHVTPVGAAREIIRAKQIETRACIRFKRKLVYFFAMRPAYKPKRSDRKELTIDHFPSVMMVDPEHMGLPFHVYPFDTGGALDGAFEEEESEHIYLDDYELDSRLQAVNDHIYWAFDTHADYFDGRLKKGFAEKFPDWDVHARTFARIAALASVGSNKPDGRASAIELAFANHVRLEQIKLIILPKQFLEDPRGNNTEVTDALRSANVEWAVYEWQPNRAPGDFHSEINAMVRGYLNDWGVL